MFADLILEAHRHRHVYYALTDKEVKQGYVNYTHDSNSGKGVHTSYKGLIDYLVDHHTTDDFNQYTVIPLSTFTVNKDVKPDDKYHMVNVKTPFKFSFSHHSKIDYPKDKT